MGRENRNIKITVRLTSNEFLQLNKHFNRSTCMQMSGYIRFVILKKPVSLNYRNQSLDDLIEELKLLRRELNAIGNNFNQVVKKLNGCRETPEIIHWSSIAASTQNVLLEKVHVIKEKIGRISDLWLQKL